MEKWVDTDAAVPAPCGVFTQLHVSIHAVVQLHYYEYDPDQTSFPFFKYSVSSSLINLR